MPFHKFNITSETVNEIRSFTTNRSEQEILADIEEELTNKNYYEIRYHLCNHDIPKSCGDEEIVASKGEIPEEPIV